GFWRFFAGDGIHAALVGTIFALLGICCGGLTWTIREHLEPADDDDELRQRRFQDAEAEVNAQEREMRRFSQPVLTIADDDLDGALRIAGRDGIDDASDVGEIAERWAVLTDQLGALGAAEQTESLLLDQRQRLSAQRQKIRLLQRTVSQARRDWCM